MLNITHDNLDTFFETTPYLVTIGNRWLMADPSDKGEPGDTVIVWPRKRAPMVLRRLARYETYEVQDTFYFATAGEQVVAVPCNKVTAVHRVIVQ